MKITGLQKMTLLDYPGKVACTVFLGGCNFRCPFCHNSQMLDGTAQQFMEQAEFFRFLEKRQGLLDGVCVTGGEPTLQPELPDFLKKIRELGYKIKLDTNGYRPEVLKSVVEQGLVDYVAMDVKNGKDAYAATCGLESMDLAKIEESILLLQTSGVDYELRTTLCRPLHDEKTVENMAHWLQSFTKTKVKQLFLQPFVDRDTVPFAGFSAPDKEELDRYVSILSAAAEQVHIRGL